MTVNRDARSRRVAVVADDLLDGLTRRARAEGIRDHPAAADGPRSGRPRAAWIEQVAEHVFEFLRNDYEVVLADDGSDGPALERRAGRARAAPIPQYAIQPPSTSRLTPDT